MPKRKAEGKAGLGALLASHTLAAVVPAHRNIITLNHSMTLKDALEELAENKILSAPVLLSPSVEDEDSGQYMGVVDVGSILRVIVNDVLDKTEGLSTSQRWEKLKEPEQLSRKLITMVSPDVSLHFKGDPNSSLLSLIKDGFLDSQDDTPRHRIAVFNARGSIINVVSQSDIVRFLAKHPHEFGSLGKKTLEELGLVTGKVESAPKTTTAADAFHEMYDKKLSGLPIVNEEGKLDTNLSASDLRGLRSGSFSALMLTVPGFLKVEKLHGHRAAKYGVDSPLVAHPYWTFEETVSKLALHKVHRLYVVDKEHHPVGVVTLTDILKLVAQHCEAEDDAKDESGSD